MNTSTLDTIKSYYDGIQRKSGWQAFVSDNIEFGGTGVKATQGKQAFVEGNDQFLRAVKAAQVKEMIVDGEKACVIVHYELLSPKGNHASSKDEILDDLRWRLLRTRRPDQVGRAGWDYGAELAYMEELLGYWLQTFDWSKQEQILTEMINSSMRRYFEVRHNPDPNSLK